MSLALKHSISRDSRYKQKTDKWIEALIKQECAKTGEPQSNTSLRLTPRLIAYSPTSKYPPDIIAEYRLLSRKKLMQPLSADEEIRLQAAVNTINEVDQVSPDAELWRAKYEELAAELKSIRQEAEALIAAQKKDGFQTKHS